MLLAFGCAGCHWCKELEPTWRRLAERVAMEMPNVVVAKLDCTKPENQGAPLPHLTLVLPSRLSGSVGPRRCLRRQACAKRTVSRASRPSNCTKPLSQRGTFAAHWLRPSSPWAHFSPVTNSFLNDAPLPEYQGDRALDRFLAYLQQHVPPAQTCVARRHAMLSAQQALNNPLVLGGRHTSGKTLRRQPRPPRTSCQRKRPSRNGLPIFKHGRCRPRPAK